MMAWVSFIGLSGLFTAAASPVGEPVPMPDAGRLRVSVFGDYEVAQVEESDCKTGNSCEGAWRNEGVGAEGQLAIVRGLGLYGVFYSTSSRVKEADYRGSGVGYGGGLRVALPLWSTGLWVAGNGQYVMGAGTGGSVDEGGQESATYRRGTGTLLLARGVATDGASLWLGAQSAWLWQLDVYPLGFVDGASLLHVPLSPVYLASGVMGASLTSDPVGALWNSSTRLNLGAEVRIGQLNGVSVWFGASY